MQTWEEVADIVAATLQIGDRRAAMTSDTALLGAIPEFDSMAVVTVLTAIEEQYDVVVEDDEIDAETFETIGTLASFVDSKL